MTELHGRYFGKLLSYLLLSLSLQAAVFILITHSPLPGLSGPALLVAAGLLPLVCYHLLVLLPLALKGGSTAAVDSVYYFGFLVTLGALAFGALGTTLAPDGKVNVEQAVAQFALGLIATGYAIVARLHLASLVSNEASANPDRTLDSYVAASRTLVLNMEQAVGALSTLSTASIQETTRVVNAAQHALTSELTSVARTFDQQLRATFGQALTDATQVRDVMSDLQAYTGRTGLTATVDRVRERLELLSSSLDGIAGPAERGARASTAFASASEALAARMQATDNGLRTLGAEDGALQQAADRIASASGTIGIASASIEEAMRSMAQVGESVSGVSATLRQTRSLATRANTALDGLTAATARLDGASGSVELMALSVGNLSAGLASTAQTLPVVVTKASEAAQALENLGGQSNAASEAVARLPAALTAAEAPLQAALANAGSIQQALGSLERQLLQAGAAMDRLVASAGEVGAATSSTAAVTDSFRQLAQQLIAIEVDLARVSASLSTGVQRAEQDLARNVTRAGEAATLFTERLTVVAQRIVEGINTGRPR